MKEVFLYLSHNLISRSRVGGRAPDIEYKEGYLEKYSFFLTISHDEIPTVGDLDISIFVKRGYLVTGDETRFPDIGVDCILHAPAPSRLDEIGRMMVIRESGLAEKGVAIDPDFYFVKIGGSPNLIQDEDYYEMGLVKSGYSFLFEVNEEGYPAEVLDGDYPFNYGALYVYGKTDADGRVFDVVAGFTQYS